MTKSPCYKCNQRVLGCHDYCRRYRNYKIELEENKLKIAKHNSECGMFTPWDEHTEKMKKRYTYKGYKITRRFRKK